MSKLVEINLLAEEAKKDQQFQNLVAEVELLKKEVASMKLTIRALSINSKRKIRHDGY